MIRKVFRIPHILAALFIIPTYWGASVGMYKGAAMDVRSTLILLIITIIYSFLYLWRRRYSKEHKPNNTRYSPTEIKLILKILNILKGFAFFSGFMMSAAAVFVARFTFQGIYDWTNAIKIALDASLVWSLHYISAIMAKLPEFQMQHQIRHQNENRWPCP